MPGFLHPKAVAMNITLPLLQQCFVMFALMGLGLLLYRLRIISDSTTKDLGALLLNVVFPVVIARSFWGKFSPENLGVLGLTFIVSFAALVLAIAVARLVFKRDGVLEFAAAFSNAGFIGIPLVEATLGTEAVFYITCFIAELNVLQWTYGKWRISGSMDAISPKAIITSPMLIGFALGVVLFLLRLPVPGVCASLMTTIANLNSPLAMIILGSYLAKSSLRDLFCGPRLYVASALRLVAIPLLTLLLLMFVPCGVEVKLALLISASAPTGSNVAVFCQQLGHSTKDASNTVCLSTLLSIASMPAIISLAALVL